MALKDVLKVNRRTFFNPRAWLGYDAVKSQTRLVVDLARDVLTTEKPERKETFEEAMKRLNVTEADVKTVSEDYLFYSILFTGFAALVFIASFVMLFYYDTFAGWLIALSIVAILLSQAFRFHFWHFQIKHRKLGCTFEEWKSGKIIETPQGPTE